MKKSVTIFIYSPIYIKENTIFYTYRDYEERFNRVTDIHELMDAEYGPESIESIFQLEQKDEINIIQWKQNEFVNLFHVIVWIFLNNFPIEISIFETSR